MQPQIVSKKGKLPFPACGNFVVKKLKELKANGKHLPEVEEVETKRPVLRASRIPEYMANS